MSNVKTKLLDIQKLSAQCQYSQSQLQQLQSQLILLPLDVPIEHELENLKSQLSVLSHQLSRSSLFLDLSSKSNLLFEKRQLLLTSAQDLSDLHYLKELTITVEHSTLNDLVSHINFQLSEVLSFLFEDPISVSFALFRETSKSSHTQQLKPSVHLSIIFRGLEYDSISSLSGGEADRVSLALTIALSNLSSCPFLLLDESLSSLDSTNKDLAVKALRSLNKTVLIVSHDSVEGVYDFVLPLS